MDNVKLQYQTKPKDNPIKIKRHDPNSALTYIRYLLKEGFRGNKFYYRDNDERLTLKVWEHEGLILTPFQRQKFLFDVTKARTIVRRRQELRGEFPESPEVEKKRFHLFTEMKDKYSKGGIFKRFHAPR